MNRLSAILAAGLLAGCMGGEEKADVKVEPFGTTKSSEAASLYTIEGKDGLKIVVSDFGGRLVKCFAPDRSGNMADVTLGWNSVKEYEELGFSMGTLIGRYGNRIRDGRFTLDGKTYQLPVNETTPAPRNCNLHSGTNGWDTQVWKAKPFAKGDVKAEHKEGPASQLTGATAPAPRERAAPQRAPRVPLARRAAPTVTPREVGAGRGG